MSKKIKIRTLNQSVADIGKMKQGDFGAAEIKRVKSLSNKGRGVTGAKAAGRSTAPVPPSGRERPPSPSRKKPPTIMDIYAKPGTRVTALYKDGKPMNGHRYDQEKVEKHLPEGVVFTVESTEVDNWSTDVYLNEVPGVSFNSVCLVDAPALGARMARPKGVVPAKQNGAKRTPKRTGASRATPNKNQGNE